MKCKNNYTDKASSLLIYTVLLSTLFFNSSILYSQTVEITLDQKIREEMDAKNIPLSERKGYYKHLLRKYTNQHTSHNPVNDITGFVAKSDNANCSNAGFDHFNFDNWEGATGFYPGPPWTIGIASLGINTDVFLDGARHTIVTTAPGNNNPALGNVVGYDPVAIHPVTGLADLPLVAPYGSGVSVRLGNGQVDNETEYLKYTMSVTPFNTTFYYYFAIVLQDPNHTVDEQPFFKISVLDQNGDPVGGACGIYYVNSTLASSDTTFIETEYDGDVLYYRKWQLVGIDLQNYVGQDITIEFQSADCDKGGHFGYAYIDAGCGLLQTNNSFCQGDTVAIISAPQGFSSYQWSGPNSPDSVIPGAVNDTLVITDPVIGGIYYLEMQSAAGCITNLQTTLQYTTLGIASTLIDNSCTDGANGAITIEPSGTTAEYTYLWTPGNDTTSTVTGLAPGDYHVIVSTSNVACGIVDTTFTVSANPVLVNFQQMAFCSNPAYATGPQGTNHQWFDANGVLLVSNDSLVINNPVEDTEITLVYNKPDGCRDSIIYTLFETGANISTSNIYFCTSSVALQGPPGTNYQWYNPDHTPITVNGNNQNISVHNPVHLSRYYVGVNSASGCRDSAIFIMRRTNSVDQETVRYCSSPVVISGPSGVDYQWYDSAGVAITLNGTVQDYTVSIPVPGTHLTIALTNSEGCRDSVIYTLNEYAQLLSATTGPDCGEARIHFNHSGVSSPYTYIIDGPGSYADTISNTSSYNIYLSDLGIGTYTVDIFFNNCTQSTAFTISDFYELSSENIPMCFGDTVVFTPPAGFHHLFDLSGNLVSATTDPSIEVVNPSPGTYIDTTFISPGCNEVTSFNVVIVELSTSTSFVFNDCHEGSIGEASVNVISGPAHPNTYSWSGPNGFTSTSPDIDGLGSGQYVVVTRSGNCITSDTVVIYSPPLPGDTLQINVIYCDLDTLAVLHAPVSPEFSDYQWYQNGNPISGATNDSLVILDPPAYETYSVTYATAPYGCIRRTVLVHREIPGALFIPLDLSNVFTPNGDGKNDVFYPFYSDLAPNPLSIDYYAHTFEITIYDRWGKKVFTSGDYAQAWDGKHNKTLMPSGVYFWVAKYIARCGSDDDEREKNGFVHLLRE